MADTPKTDADKDPPSSAEPTPKATTKPGLPTIEELKRRGWKVAEPSGKGFVLPLHGPPPKPEA